MLLLLISTLLFNNSMPSVLLGLRQCRGFVASSSAVIVKQPQTCCKALATRYSCITLQLMESLDICCYPKCSIMMWCAVTVFKKLKNVSRSKTWTWNCSNVVFSNGVTFFLSCATLAYNILLYECFFLLLFYTEQRSCILICVYNI